MSFIIGCFAVIGMMAVLAGLIFLAYSTIYGVILLAVILGVPTILFGGYTLSSHIK